MSRLSAVLRLAEGDSLMFWCPGCQMIHQVTRDTAKGYGPRWHWDGNVNAPTFSPSILVRWHQWTPPATDPVIAAKIATGEVVQVKVDHVCHSFVRAGRIQFLDDCTHKLAGQTVDLPSWPATEDDW